MDEYLEKAVTIGLEQFWGSIAESFPDVKSGDMEPNEVIRFENQAKKQVAIWLKNNAQ